MQRRNSPSSSRLSPAKAQPGRLEKTVHFARPTIISNIRGPEDQRDQCHCGCFFAHDCVFCRRCGARRSVSDVDELGQSETDSLLLWPSAASGLTDGERKEFDERRTTQKEFYESGNHFDCPTARNLTLMQVAMSLGYSAYLMTSWTYVTMRTNETFPVCSQQWPYSWEMSFFCSCSILSFWCFPLVCCILLVIFFYRELLHTRLYYVMLTHRVLLDFANESFWDSGPVRCMIAFLVVGLSSYPLGNQMTLAALTSTLPWWIPVASSSFMVYGYWDLETRLLSLAKFVEENIGSAKQHVAMSYFIRNYVAETAYWNLWANWPGGEAPRYTGQYIELLVRECERLESLQDHLDQIADAASNSQLNVQQWHPNYWVSDFLYTKKIIDAPTHEERPRDEFRFWFRLYFCYSCLMLAVLIYFLLCTIVSHLHHQEIIVSGVWTELFRFQNVANELEVQKQAVGVETMAVARGASPIVHAVYGLVHF